MHNGINTITPETVGLFVAAIALVPTSLRTSAPLTDIHGTMKPIVDYLPSMTQLGVPNYANVCRAAMRELCKDILVVIRVTKC